MINRATLIIPKGLSFSDLEMKLTADGEFSYRADILINVFHVSGYDVSKLIEQDIAGAIVAWYLKHTEKGGEPNELARHMVGKPTDDPMFNVVLLSSE